MKPCCKRALRRGAVGTSPNELSLHLNSEARLLDDLQHLLVSCPVILPWRLFHSAPLRSSHTAAVRQMLASRRQTKSQSFSTFHVEPAHPKVHGYPMHAGRDQHLQRLGEPASTGVSEESLCVYLHQKAEQPYLATESTAVSLDDGNVEQEPRRTVSRGNIM